MILPDAEHAHLFRAPPPPTHWEIPKDGGYEHAVYRTTDDAALALGREIAIALSSGESFWQFGADKYHSVFGRDARDDDTETVRSNLIACAMFWIDPKEDPR